jgi:hypothetical protein
MTILNTLIPVSPEQVDLTRPYECPFCHRHMCLDRKYLKQENTSPICPYCFLVLKVPYEPERI